MERLFRMIRERFLVEIEATGIASIQELNDRFLAWAEAYANTRIHAETRQAPIARFLAGGPPTFPDPERLAEAFRWSLSRMVSSTATVSLLGNRYQVDAALVGRRVECRFVPEDLTAVAVYLEGRPVGAAVPFVISAHTHPQVPKPPPASQPATGIDYLGLVLGVAEDATPGAIHYRNLGEAEEEDGPEEQLQAGQP